MDVQYEQTENEVIVTDTRDRGQPACFDEPKK